MAWTTPYTWLTGDVITAARLNAMQDNLSYLYANLPVLEYGVGDVLNNSNVETTFATTTLTAGVLGTTGGAYVESWVVISQASGGAMNYTWRFKLGATTIFASTISQASNAAVWATYRFVFFFGNMESASAQRCAMHTQGYTGQVASQTVGQTSQVGTWYNTCAENSANALALAFTGQMASAHASASIWHLGTKIWAPLN